MEIDRRIKIRHLRTFVEVARSASVGRAAELMHVSQPAVSKTLAELESVLGARLMERNRSGVALTPSRGAKSVVGQNVLDTGMTKA